MTPTPVEIDQDASLRYWSSVPATVNGMLGGYPQVSQIDLRGSSKFLAKVRRLLPSSSSTAASDASCHSSLPRLARGVDCGAGIGRVTNGFLRNVCDVVDVVEPVDAFAAVVRKSKTGDGSRSTSGRIGDIYVVGLEDWDPSAVSEGMDAGKKVYDLIWMQWCVGYLDDAQFVELLRRCQRHLSPSGLIVVKDNVARDGDIYHKDDSSVTRTDATFRAIFKDAGLNLFKSEEQLGFPKSLGLYPVRFYALRSASVKV